MMMLFGLGVALVVRKGGIIQEHRKVNDVAENANEGQPAASV